MTDRAIDFSKLCSHPLAEKFHDAIQTVEHLNCDSTSEINKLRALAGDVEKELGRLERELEEARDVPWPDWADTILKTLKKYGYDPVDDAGEVDLGEAFEDYLGGIDHSDEQYRKQIAEKDAEITRLQSELSGKDTSHE